MRQPNLLKTLLLLCALGVGSCAHDTSSNALSPASRLVIKTLDRGTRHRQYALYIPDAVALNKGARIPVMVYLHDAAASGGNPLHLLLGGLASHLQDPRQKFPFLVIFPQSEDGTWNPESETATDILAELDAVAAAYPVDPDCVILTGMGIGGAGTWDIGAQFPQRFAALIPMASTGIRATDADKLIKMPIRAFHGMRDTLAPLSNDETPVKKIATLGGAARFMKTNSTHDCMDDAFASSDLVAWCHEQRRSPAAQ